MPFSVIDQPEKHSLNLWLGFSMRDCSKEDMFTYKRVILLSKTAAICSPNALQTYVAGL